MRRLHTMLAFGLLAAATSPALAQEGQPAPRERNRTFVYSSGPQGMMASQRGRLGISVDLRPDPATDSIGAKVAGVTPGGAADRAGVHAGDIVVRLNGTRLAVAEPRGGEEEDDNSSRPGLRLVRLASRLDPGDTVRLEVRRDGRPQTFTFAAEQSDLDRMIVRNFDVSPQVMAGPGEIFLRAGIGAPLSELELVKVNPGLGEYFGTNEGLLVVNVGSDSALGLRAGDVILTIGGRRPTSPPHAMRILGTYDANEQVQFEVMRQKHRTTVSGHMPQSRMGEWRVRPNSFDFTLPRQPLMELQELMPQLEQLPRMMEERVLPRLRMEMRGPGQMQIIQPKSLVRVDGIV